MIARMNVGGPARQVTVLHSARGLGHRGFEQLLLVGQVGSDESDELALRAPDIASTQIKGLGRAPHPWDDLRAFRAIRRELLRFRPDVVHTHTAKAGVLGRVAAWSLPTKPATVHTFHGHLLHGYFHPAVRAGVVATEKALARRTTRLVAVGSRVRDELLTAGIGSAEQFRVVPPGVNLPPAPPKELARETLAIDPDAGLVIGFAGRLTSIKRPDRLLAAAWELCQRGFAPTVLVAGQGELETDMREQAVRLGLAQSVRFLGMRADMQVVWAACDVAVVTSDNEGMPMALIEAALVGRPAVTTDVGSAGEVVIDGSTGFVVASTPTAVADALARFTDSELRNMMGAAAQRHASDHFSGERLVSDTANLYRTLGLPPES